MNATCPHCRRKMKIVEGQPNVCPHCKTTYFVSSLKHTPRLDPNVTVMLTVALVIFIILLCAWAYWEVAHVWHVLWTLTHAV